MTVTLPDSTTVMLAPNSQLRIPADYGVDRRDLALQGAGYFDVTPSAERPFTVFAENSSTRVLGTTFAVVAYPHDSTVTVVVRAGKVALSGTGVLTAGDVGTLSASGRGAVRHGEDLRQLLAWTKGTLVFDDAPVARVLTTLQQWYGVRVYTHDPALSRREITVTFQGETRAEMLSTLAVLLHVTPVERADGVQLVPR
jgi:transmembrane sensor